MLELVWVFLIFLYESYYFKNGSCKLGAGLAETGLVDKVTVWLGQIWDLLGLGITDFLFIYFNLLSQSMV